MKIVKTPNCLDFRAVAVKDNIYYGWSAAGTGPETLRSSLIINEYQYRRAQVRDDEELKKLDEEFISDYEDDESWEDTREVYHKVKEDGWCPSCFSHCKFNEME